jgi:hypothetical protein
VASVAAGWRPGEGGPGRGRRGKGARLGGGIVAGRGKGAHLGGGVVAGRGKGAHLGGGVVASGAGAPGRRARLVRRADWLAARPREGPVQQPSTVAAEPPPPATASHPGASPERSTLTCCANAP